MQSNEEKFQLQKAFFEKAQKQLSLLWSESLVLDLDEADKILDKCHTELTSMKVIHETIGQRQFRRIPHGIVPDIPIAHHSNYAS